MMLDQRGRDAAEDLRSYATERAAEADFTRVRRNDRRHRLVSVVAIAVFGVALVMATAWLRGSAESPVVTEPPPTTTETAPTTTVPAITTTPTTGAIAVSTTVVPSPIVPALGDGWEVVLSTRPGDTRLLGIETVFPTAAGYYLAFLENDATDWYLMILDGDEHNLVDVDVEVPVTGFVTGGPGVVAWATVGPETRTEAQLWVSSDGIAFERVAEDELVGCADLPGCQGTEIYAAAASPAGRVVALGYDALVWDPECDCFDLNPVALVSDDGYEWTKQPLDLHGVLPAQWQAAADIRNPLVYVDGRWLTYATHYSNDCMCTDTALFTSEDGIDWQLVDTAGLFDSTYISGIAANDHGVVATTMQAGYWSADGIEWTRTALTDRDQIVGVAAYDDGYAAIGIPGLDGTHLGAIWYSANGTTWSRMPLQLEESTNWNTIVGDGPNLVAVGGTQTNLYAIWRWSS